jgi:hypothetical protein
MQFVSFPIADRGVPASRQEVHSLVQRLVPPLNEGRGVTIHCR